MAEFYKKLPPPPKFTEKKLAEVLHYTDSPENPSYECFKSDSVYELHAGAKGVSKSFNNVLITIYRIVNDIRFNSIWCRNQYNHIKNSLRGTFEKALDFLAVKHNLDFKNYFEFREKAIYWTYDDDGQGRAIFFENWEKGQAFQGITLKKENFLWGELVIDEPIEDPNDKEKTLQQRRELYATQYDRLPLLIQNTIYRMPAPVDFQQKIKFNYNIFTTEHFLIQNYHNKVMKFLDDKGNVLDSFMKELIEKTFIMKEDKEFEKDEETGASLGCIVVQYSKAFTPKSSMTKKQWTNLNSLKETNERLWMITVAGLAFEDPENKPFYYLEKPIEKSNSIENITSYDSLPNGSIVAIFDGFDIGIKDNSSWVRIALLKNHKIVVLDAVEDVKKLVKQINSKQIYNSIAEILIDCLHISNNNILKNHHSKLIKKYRQEFKNVVLVDNTMFGEILANKIFQNEKNMDVVPAKRRKTKNEDFSIVSRQRWEKHAFENKMISFENKPTAKLLISRLIKMYINPGEEQRDETVNANIYDLVNAFEMAVSWIYPLTYKKGDD